MQEIHILFIALYGTLLRKAVLPYYACSNSSDDNGVDYREFTKWLDSISLESNMDQTSQTWASTMQLLCGYVGYYFAVRSGNWLLQNSCLRAVTPNVWVQSQQI